MAAVRGVDDLDMVRRGLDCQEDDYQAVHDATQALTDHLDEAIGFPLEGRPDYGTLAPLFLERFHTLAMLALDTSAALIEPAIAKGLVGLCSAQEQMRHELDDLTYSVTVMLDGVEFNCQSVEVVTVQLATLYKRHNQK